MAAAKQSRRADRPPPDNPVVPPDSDGTPSPVSNSQPTASPSEAGSTEKQLPAFKVGPIPTDRSNAVCCTVWEHEVTATDGQTFKVHNVTVQASYRDADGHWKPAKGFRGSQLYVVLYCLQRASDFILAQRDPANDCPF